MAAPGHYTLQAHCTNCGHRFLVPIELGTERPTGPICCPQCCCNTARFLPVYGPERVPWLGVDPTQWRPGLLVTCHYTSEGPPAERFHPAGGA